MFPALPSPDILRQGHKLEVPGVEARSVPAQVIDLHGAPGRKVAVRCPISLPVDAFLRVPVDTVPTLRESSCPYPTRIVSVRVAHGKHFFDNADFSHSKRIIDNILAIKTSLETGGANAL
jgi:hypothetical protein